MATAFLRKKGKEDKKILKERVSLLPVIIYYRPSFLLWQAEVRGATGEILLQAASSHDQL